MGQNVVPYAYMGVPYEYTHMGRPIRVWVNIRIWGRTVLLEIPLGANYVYVGWFLLGWSYIVVIP